MSSELMCDALSGVPPLAATGYGLLVILGVFVDIGLFIHVRRHPVPWEVRCREIATRTSWTSEDLGLLAGGLIVIHGLTLLLFQPVMNWLGASPGNATTAGFIMHGITFHLAGIGIIMLIVRRKGWRGMPVFRQRFGRLPGEIGTGALLYLAMLPLVVAASLVAYATLVKLGYPVSLQDVAIQIRAMPNIWVRLYAVLLAVVIGPVFEEMLFRGMLLPVIARHTGAGWAILLTSLFFAVFHMHLPSAAALAIVAAFCGSAYLATGSLAVPIAMHSLFNTVNLALLLTAS